MTARALTLAASLLLGIASSGVAMAGTISGTTASDPTVNAALTGGTVINFDSTTSGLYSELTIGNVKFTGVDADLTVGTDWNGSFNTRGTKSLYNDFDFAPQEIRFDFTQSVTAFAFLWGAADEIWDLKAYDSSDNLIDSLQLPIVFASNAGDYFGITGTDIKYATLIQRDQSKEDFVMIDNFTHTAVAVVPLPPSALMGLALLGGMGGLAWLRRRRNAAAFA